MDQNVGHSLAFSLVALFLITGCSGPQSRQATRGNGTQSTTENGIRSTATASGSGRILDAFDFVEEREGKDPVPLSADRSVIPIDINSNIRVVVNKGKLAEIRDPDASERPALPGPADFETWREKLTEALRKWDAYLALVLEIQPLWAQTHDASGKRIDGTEAQIRFLETKQKEKDRLGLEMLQLLKDYIISAYKEEVGALRAEAKAENPARDSDTLDRLAIGRWMKQHIWSGGTEPSATNQYDHANLRRFVKQEIDLVVTLTESRDESLRAAGFMGALRLRANFVGHDGSLSPLHLNNYDEIEAGVPVIKPKVTFELSEEQRAQLKKEVRFYSDLAKVIKDLSTKDSRILGSLEDRFRELRVAAKQVSDRRSKDIREKVVTGIADATTKLGLPQTNALVRKLNTLAADTTSKVLGGIENFKNIPTGSVSPEDLLVDFGLGQITNFVSAGRDLKNAVDPKNPESITKALIDSIEEIKGNTQLKTQLGDPLFQQVIELLQGGQGSLKETSEEVDALIAVLGEMKSLMGASGVVRDVGKGTEFDDKRFKVPVDQVRDTEIPLITAGEREENDQIHFHAELSSDGTDSDDASPIDGTKVFRIVKYGFRGDPSTGLIFVKRLDPPAGARNSDFVPAPVVSYNFRYRTRGKSVFSRIWDKVDLGVGIHTTLLNFDDSDIELGVGPVVTLFGNFVSAGFGYDLQADSRGEYFYLGIGLLEIFKTVSGSF